MQDTVLPKRSFILLERLPGQLLILRSSLLQLVSLPGFWPTENLNLPEAYSRRQAFCGQSRGNFITLCACPGDVPRPLIITRSKYRASVLIIHPNVLFLFQMFQVWGTKVAGVCQWETVKAGLWTLDWTVDWTVARVRDDHYLLCIRPLMLIYSPVHLVFCAYQLHFRHRLDSLQSLSDLVSFIEKWTISSSFQVIVMMR